MVSVEELPVTAQMIVDATKRHVTMAKVYDFTLRGLEDEMFREQILLELHAMHLGMVRIK